jgi:hypothetical protein
VIINTGKWIQFYCREPDADAYKQKASFQLSSHRYQSIEKAFIINDRCIVKLTKSCRLLHVIITTTGHDRNRDWDTGYTIEMVDDSFIPMLYDEQDQSKLLEMLEDFDLPQDLAKLTLEYTIDKVLWADGCWR